MKQLEVHIMGQNYLLACPENGEAQLRQAVSLVDSSMCKIRDAGKIKARDRIAVLVALNLAFELTERAPAELTEPSANLPVDKAAEELIANAQAAQLSELVQRLDAALGTSKEQT